AHAGLLRCCFSRARTDVTSVRSFFSTERARSEEEAAEALRETSPESTFREWSGLFVSSRTLRQEDFPGRAIPSVDYPAAPHAGSGSHRHSGCRRVSPGVR